MPAVSPPAARWLERLLGVTALGLCLASGLAMLAQRAWLAELFTHFRLQYLAAALVLVPLLAWRRRWGLVALVAGFSVVNGAVLLPYLPRATAALAAEPGLTLMTVNLHAGNRDHARFLDLVRRERPDVMVLLELDSTWARALGALAEEYPAQVLAPREGPFGIALLTRLPLLESRVADLRGAPAIDARIALADAALRLIGVHLRPPMSQTLAYERDAQLAELGRLIDDAATPLIVTGDFNLTPYSPVFARWMETSGLTDVRRDRRLGVTWPTYLPVLGIPIDHCLISAHFIVAEQYEGPAFGSDHYPVLTELVLRGNE